MDEKVKKERAARLRKARKDAGFETATDAASAFGWPKPAYISHENGTRGILPDTAAKYAPRLRVAPEFILYNRARTRPQAENPVGNVPLVGKVGAGARAFFFDDQGDLDDVPAPGGSTDSTVAVQIEGDSLGPSFNGWLVFYDDVHRPVHESLLGRLCVVGLSDGRILIKTLQKARGRPGTFHLLSNNEPPILDVEVEWAARVKLMQQRDR